MDELYFAVDNVMWGVWVCLGVALAAAFWLLTVYRRRVARVAAVAREQGLEAECVAGDGGADNGGGGEGAAEAKRLEGVSVLVYVQDNAEGLARVLASLWGQRLEGVAEAMEVIVINDGGAEDVKDVFNLNVAEHPELRMTFVPGEAHNLSRRKLGISLGVKAARYECMLLITSECRMESDRWLELMCRPFSRGKRVVLGFAAVEGLKRWMDRYDEVATAVTWLSAAIDGKPYRGTGFNIGYTRSDFFRNKGFSGSLNLHNGDDDLFINGICRSGAPAEVVLAPQARVSLRFHNPHKEFRNLRLAHIFTGRRLPVRSRLQMGMGTLMMWVWLAATVCGLVFSIPNLLPGCFFVALVPAVWVPLVVTWRRTGAALGVRLPAVVLPWQMLTRCLRGFRWYLRSGTASRRNYTWLQH